MNGTDENMGIKKLLCCAVLTAAVALSTASCGSHEESKLNYEQPIVSMRGALNYGDDTAYLCCYLPQEKNRFLKSEEYKEGFTADVFSRKDYYSLLQIKISDSCELTREELDALEKQAKETYGTRFDFTKGHKLSLDFRVNAKIGKLCDSRELTVVRYESVWYIYGEVVDSLSFMPDEDQ